MASAITYQENSSRIRYTGRWARADYAGYSGGHARYSRTRGAAATLSFTGAAVAWIGPRGPTRGSAKVYVDGNYVKTVSSYSSSFRASRVLFRQVFNKSGTHRLKIVVQGTRGHPMVAIDRFVVSTEATPPLTSAPAVTPVIAGNTVTVSSISSLLTALGNDTVGDIVVKNGTYHVSPSRSFAADSLWIGPAFAERTRPVTVRAETRGGVTFDGGGASGYGGLSFEDGAHDQTWDGFNFANMTGSSSGIIEFGGYSPRRSPHHITLRNITIRATCRRASSGSNQEQGIYFANGTGSGPYALLLEDITIIGTDPLSVRSGLHAYHGDASAPAAHDVTVRRAKITGTYDPIILWWTAPTKNWRFEDITISGALHSAVRFEEMAQTNIVFSNVVSTGSAQGGFYSSLGATPPGVTFVNSSLR